MLDVAASSRHGVLELDAAGTLGVLADGARVIVAKGGGTRLAIDVADPPITGVLRIPASLGGGFLFRSASSIFTSYAFDGWLRPIVTLPAPIAAIAFGPKGALVRSAAGERWSFDLRSGSRQPIDPPGLVDVAATPDGRAVALIEGGGALISRDGGDHWTDLRPWLTGAPTELRTTPGELWIVQDRGALRVGQGGSVTAFVGAPTIAPVPAKDARWRGPDSPLRLAARAGARTGEATAVVAASGDIVEIDLRTGAIGRVVPGIVPPDLACEALRTARDVLFVCAADGRPSVVVSLLSAGGPRIERSFATRGPFYASDDGGLVYGGPCATGEVSAARKACARDAGGAWAEATVDPTGQVLEKVGAPTIATRWVPRASGPPLAIAIEGGLRTIDPATQRSQALRTQGVAPDVVTALTRAAGASTGSRTSIVDRAWSTTPRGAVRAWMDGGRAAEIAPDGSITVSAFVFPGAYVDGALALARAADGRTWQSTDGGGRWLEVAPPPSSPAGRSATVQGCSEVGCDLGSWVRIGWDAWPPAPRPLPPRAPSPPSLERAPLPELVCRVAGDGRSATPPPTAVSPADLGLGAQRVPFSFDPPGGDAITVDREALSRGLVNAPHGRSVEAEDAPRALVIGYRLDASSQEDARDPLGAFVVHGPNRSAGAYRRDVAYVEPFDPRGAVSTAGFAMKDLAALGRAAGVPPSALLAPDSLAFRGAVPILPSTADAASNALLLFTEGDEARLLATVRGASVALGWVAGEVGPIVSAVELPDRAIALLSVDANGASRVSKLAGATVTLLFDLPSSPSGESYPANPDALAIAPDGSLAVIRTPSGSEPPSAADPALLITPGAEAPIALAPWSTLTSASDAACRRGGGYRAIVQSVGPWLRVRGASAPADAVGVMSARVRWSRDRVCLEAIELPVDVRTGASGDVVESHVVARFGTSPAAGRIGVALGSEAQQPLVCELPTPALVASPAARPLLERD